jgi:hypothetical protein
MTVLVAYDNDETEDVEVRVGQRDAAAWERAREYIPDRKILGFRYSAYAALRRERWLPKDDQGRPVSWQVWDAMVDEVDLPDDTEGDEDADRPTGEGQPNEG